MGGVEAGVGGGVKIIVKMDAVQRIVLHQFGHALHDIVGGFRDAGFRYSPSPTVQTQSGWVFARLVSAKLGGQAAELRSR